MYLSIGYKPSAAKSAAEYAQLDAEDESLARWKASLGIVPGTGGPSASGPKVSDTQPRLVERSYSSFYCRSLSSHLNWIPQRYRLEKQSCLI